ncbi:hypothetical protein GPECTOR_388g198 [Gonium pectorale]|uniref:Uncharacterized protein n=1 Tax=Gonium pectorale TaxID=33097 RepID=A0A150FVB9_GONPE|nr:hypothetical protein GPECTOR_388g198 [Gonium pectorale]|eukprot:KXZ41571.1 hypothetical protein GPECTOR_388g198 [Gonium pectorale]
MEPTTVRCVPLVVMGHGDPRAVKFAAANKIAYGNYSSANVVAATRTSLLIVDVGCIEVDMLDRLGSWLYQLIDITACTPNPAQAQNFPGMQRSLRQHQPKRFRSTLNTRIYDVEQTPVPCLQRMLLTKSLVYYPPNAQFTTAPVTGYNAHPLPKSGGNVILARLAPRKQRNANGSVSIPAVTLADADGDKVVVLCRVTDLTPGVTDNPCHAAYLSALHDAGANGQVVAIHNGQVSASTEADDGRMYLPSILVSSACVTMLAAQHEGSTLLDEKLRASPEACAHLGVGLDGRVLAAGDATGTAPDDEVEEHLIAAAEVLSARQAAPYPMYLQTRAPNIFITSPELARPLERGGAAAAVAPLQADMAPVVAAAEAAADAVADAAAAEVHANAAIARGAVEAALDAANMADAMRAVAKAASDAAAASAAALHAAPEQNLGAVADDDEGPEQADDGLTQAGVGKLPKRPAPDDDDKASGSGGRSRRSRGGARMGA